MSQKNIQVQEWLMDNGLLASSMVCTNCGSNCELVPKTNKIDGRVWRCSKDGRHEWSLRKYSFFSGSHFTIQDIMMFIRSFLSGMSLHQCSKESGLGYSNTSVHWASYCREIMKTWVFQNVMQEPFSGTIEIDESLFGRRTKYHRGKPGGCRVWIFGMTERDSGRLILYPVDDRTEDTLCTIIEKHVKAGSRIFSDGWAAYGSLNKRGYEHFTVIHKHSFKRVYKNTVTDEVVEVHTNRIEGSWKHAKDHFKRINGTSIGNFEAHLAEVMFRNFNRGSITSAFFDELRRVYTLSGEAHYDCPSPFFDSWSGNLDKSLIHRDSESDEDEGGDVPVIDDPDSAVIDEDESSQEDVRPGKAGSSRMTPQPKKDTCCGGKDDNDENEAVPKLQDVRRRRRTKEVTCHPPQFVPLDEVTSSSRRLRQKKASKDEPQYSKKGRLLKKRRFSWALMSSDSDFQ